MQAEKIVHFTAEYRPSHSFTKFVEEPKSIHEAIKTYINMCNNYIEKYLKSYSKKDKEQLFIEKLNQFFVREEKYNEFIKSNLYKSIIEKLKD